MSEWINEIKKKLSTPEYYLDNGFPVCADIATLLEAIRVKDETLNIAIKTEREINRIAFSALKQISDEDIDNVAGQSAGIADDAFIEIEKLRGKG